MIQQHTLQEAAYQLLASSTIQRYLREARRITKDHDLLLTSHDSPDITIVEEPTREYLQKVNEKPQRDIAEIKAVLMLCAISSAKRGEPILKEGARSRSPWIRAAAKRLLAEKETDNE